MSANTRLSRITEKHYREWNVPGWIPPPHTHTSYLSTDKWLAAKSCYLRGGTERDVNAVEQLPLSAFMLNDSRRSALAAGPGSNITAHRHILHTGGSSLTSSLPGEQSCRLRPAKRHSQVANMLLPLCNSDQRRSAPTCFWLATAPERQLSVSLGAPVHEIFFFFPLGGNIDNHAPTLVAKR